MVYAGWLQGEGALFLKEVMTVDLSPMAAAVVAVNIFLLAGVMVFVSCIVYSGTVVVSLNGGWVKWV